MIKDESLQVVFEEKKCKILQLLVCFFVPIFEVLEKIDIGVPNLGFQEALTDIFHRIYDFI